MGWYKFTTEAEFNAWHDALKLDLGYPFPSKDANGNDCEPMNTEYTSLSFINDEFKAWVDEDKAEGLTPTTEPVYPSRYKE
jgi:hypothetical protein